jgi:hypothetical protein
MGISYSEIYLLFNVVHFNKLPNFNMFLEYLLNTDHMTDESKTNRESFKVTGDEIISKVKEIIREGNARKIIIRNDKDETIMEFTLTIGAIGAVLAPVFAAVGAIAALASDCTIIVEKHDKTGKI